MKTIEIYWKDLTIEKQMEVYEDLYHTNIDHAPIAIIEIEEPIPEEPEPFNPANKEYVSWDYAKTQLHDTNGTAFPERYKYWIKDGVYYPAFSTYTIPNEKE